MHQLLPTLDYRDLPALDHSLVDLPWASWRRMLAVALCHKVSNLDDGECWCVYVREGGNLKELEMCMRLCMCVHMLGGDKASV